MASRALAAVGIFGILLAGMTFGGTAAVAAGQNEKIELAVTSITPADAQATVGDTLTVSGTWSAVDAEPKAGDTFSIGLPKELGLPEAVPFNLEGEGGVVWAECLTDPATGIVNCELTSAVTANPEVVQGTFEFEVTALEATTEETVDFNLNGKETPVDLPGEGGIDDGIVPPADWSKSGAMNSDHWSMGWTIDLPGGALAGHKTVNVSEILSDSHQLCDPSGVKVTAVRGGESTPVDGIVEMVPGADAQHFTWQLTQPATGWDDKTMYRLTYNTCTPDGEIDDKGTEYTNEAIVDVFGDASSGVIGVTQDWGFQGEVAKSGSVLGGADRNGKIAWNVAVDGDKIAGKTSFTFEEVLSGDHKVCDTTIPEMKVFERYGPSGVKRVDITSKIAVGVDEQSDQAFKTTIAKTDDGFAFKPHPYVYEIEYKTCATTDGLPAGGTPFTNKATVEGTTGSSTAKVPGRGEGKSGDINKQKVTIAGEEFMPQTTMNWGITIPGQSVKDVTTDLKITDILSDTQQVCEIDGKSIAERLDLRVHAFDQVQNGGLPTVDLTKSVQTALEGDTITFSIPRPTLEMPDKSTAVGFSHEYQYVLSYKTCTTSGGMDAPGTVYSNAVEVNGKKHESSFTQNNKGSGTGQGMTRGTVAVVKSLEQTPGAAYVPADTVFTVNAKEYDPKGVLQNEFTLNVPLNGEPVSGPNARGTGWTIELSEPSFPNVPGVAFGEPRFEESTGVTVKDGGKVATAVLTPATNIKVSLVNEAKLGSVALKKEVNVDGEPESFEGEEFTFTASVDTSSLGDTFAQPEDREFTIKAHETYTLNDLPIGATVTFDEVIPQDDDRWTWGKPEVDGESFSVTVTDPDTVGIATLLVTNQATRTVGTFSLSKTVTGEEKDNAAVPEFVDVVATWDQMQIDEPVKLRLPTDGTPVEFGHDLYIGTEVTLTEVAPVDGSGIAWATPEWSGDGVNITDKGAVVTIGRDADAHVSLENHAATSTAGISLLKSVAGEAAGEVPADAEFPVTATWTDADGKKQTKELLINSKAPVELGVELPAGTVVTITEGKSPKVDTVNWGSIVIAGEGVEDKGDGVAEITVSDQQDANTLVTVTNEANWAPGTFSLSKQVEGVALDHADTPESFTVEASWYDAEMVEQTETIELPADGTVVDFGRDLPHGTEVKLTEVAPENSASFTWGAPVWGGDSVAHDDNSATVTIGAATTASVELTNTATELLGALDIEKVLAGDAAAKVKEGTEFPVTITWNDLFGAEQTLESNIVAGETTKIEGIPLGTEVTVTEQKTELAEGVRWEGVTWESADEHVVAAASGDTGITVTVTGEAGVSAALTATNTVTEVPTNPIIDIVTDLTGKKPEELAATGTTLSIAGIVLAAGAVIAGGFMMMRRRVQR